MLARQHANGTGLAAGGSFGQPYSSISADGMTRSLPMHAMNGANSGDMQMPLGPPPSLPVGGSGGS